MAVKRIATKPGEVAEVVPTLSLKDAVAMIVGIVVGAGIFRTPSLVAANVSSETNALLLWLAGGIVSLIGAFCYAELTATYPHTGGDYHYLSRAYGRPLSFLFVWSRVTVIQTGSVALLSFVFGDYASQLLRLGEYSPSIYAALLVVILTGLNVLGVHQGTRTQNYLTVVEVFSLLLIIIAGLFLVDSPSGAAQSAPLQSSVGSIGLAMVFVLLTYGGWNEAAYISAETTDRRDVARALLLSIAIVTGLYLLVNWAYLRGLGLSGVASSEAVATDLMKLAVGDRGALFVTLLVAISAITSANATVFTGARTNYAFGRDFPMFGFLGRWQKSGNTPTNALLVQGALALGLVLIGTLTRKGFATMVEYTAPVFWFFFFMVGLSLIVLRIREPDVVRPFRTPLYPLLPVAFCLSCLYMLQASIVYVFEASRRLSGEDQAVSSGIGALAGILVLLMGIPVFLLARNFQRVASTRN
ncbi:MAG: amino acid permease [Acidobacteriota bacterium]|nr:amino acid permease [Acidobacteriota bacterium]